MGRPYCSIIGGRRFLCEDCSQKLANELEALTLSNQALQDKISQLQNTIKDLLDEKETSQLPNSKT